MASQAQTLANQQNSLHSTGPTTEPGKLRSSLNSFKHGLTANTVVLPSEDIAVYQEFSRRLLLDYEPEGAAEEQLAQTAIDTQWRLNRVPALETNLLALAHFEPAPQHLADVQDAQTRAALLEANALIAYERPLRNLHLQEQRLHRLLRRTLEDLATHQQARQATESATAEPADPEIGFDFTPGQFQLHYTSRATPETFQSAPEIPLTEAA